MVRHLICTNPWWKWTLACLCLVTMVEPCRAASSANPAQSISFQRVLEPREGAFSILVPRGWSARGGIYRVDPLQAGGPLNSMEAKCDLSFSSDARGSVRFQILPDIIYAHAGIGGGYFQSYQGAVVRPLQDAPAFLRSLFSQLHPEARQVREMYGKRLPGEIEAMERGAAFTNRILTQIGGSGLRYRHDAAACIFDYTEGGIAYREILATGIIDMPAAMTWKNTRTLSFRAPRAEFDPWRPVFDIMRFSVRFSPRWVLAESNGQRERADIAMKVFAEMKRIDQEMMQRTRANREEIMNDNFLVLTGQEEYVNPHTGEIETDTDTYRHRWTTPGGDVYFTNREEEDPNLFLQRSDYRRTPVRKRRNE